MFTKKALRIESHIYLYMVVRSLVRSLTHSLYIHSLTKHWLVTNNWRLDYCTRNSERDSGLRNVEGYGHSTTRGTSKYGADLCPLQALRFGHLLTYEWNERPFRGFYAAALFASAWASLRIWASSEVWEECVIDFKFLLGRKWGIYCRIWWYAKKDFRQLPISLVILCGEKNQCFSDFETA